MWTINVEELKKAQAENEEYFPVQMDVSEAIAFRMSAMLYLTMRGYRPELTRALAEEFIVLSAEICTEVYKKQKG